MANETKAVQEDRRRLCLNQAISSSYDSETPKEIVARAQTYENYLKGETS